MGDRLVAVSPKGDGTFTRVAGVRSIDLVALFNGKAGEPISLEIEHADGKSEVITIKRERIEIADLAASSQTVETPSGRLGYLRLPSFYVTAPSSNGTLRSSSVDVRTELRKHPIGYDGEHTRHRRTKRSTCTTRIQDRLCTGDTIAR